MLHDVLTVIPGVGDGIGRVWGLKNVQGKLAPSDMFPSLRLVNSREDGGILFWRSRHVSQLGSGQRRCLHLR